MLNRANIYKVVATMSMLLSVVFAAFSQEPPMTVTATSDSTSLVMGDRITVNVEVLKNSHPGLLLDMPQRGKDYHGMELADCVVDSTDLGNGRIQLVYRMTFQAFDPADILTLPGFAYACGGDTAVSDILTFKVLPVELSPELGDPADVENLKIHPDEKVVAIPSKWYDYIPDWWIWVVLALAVVGLGVVVWLLYKKNGPNIFVHRKPIPPYEMAIESLNKLRAKHLIENGLAKQFYTEATDIWRTYLKGRFDINAMEMTSRQIIAELRGNKEVHLTVDQIEPMLQLSDFVKFAALKPTRDEMEKAYGTIYSFVEATRPEPAADEEDPDHKNPKTKDK